MIVTAGGVGGFAVIAFYGLAAAGEIEQGTTFRAEAKGSDNVHRAAATFGVGSTYTILLSSPSARARDLRSRP